MQGEAGAPKECLCPPFTCLTVAFPNKAAFWRFFFSGISIVEIRISLMRRRLSTWATFYACSQIFAIHQMHILLLNASRPQESSCFKRMMRTGQLPVSHIAQHINPSDLDLTSLVLTSQLDSQKIPDFFIFLVSFQFSMLT